MTEFNIAGLDIGYALPPKKSTGVGIWRKGEAPVLEKRCRREQAWNPMAKAGPFDVIAIDGPIIPPDANENIVRSVECIFQRGKFQKRCKPGSSHSGRGLEFRNEAAMATDKLKYCAPITQKNFDFPEIRPGSAIVEAFPNGYLGVCLSEDTYNPMPKIKRNEKFDWLYDRAIEQKIVHRMECLSKREKKEWQAEFEKEDDHEKRAALVCLLTALPVTRECYTAVGDEAGGWFFLPPWSAWAEWAKEEVIKQIERFNDEKGATVQLTCKSQNCANLAS